MAIEVSYVVKSHFMTDTGNRFLAVAEQLTGMGDAQAVKVAVEIAASGLGKKA